MAVGIKKILCSIGLRGNCDKVIEECMNIALVTGADVHLLHVVKALPEEVMSTLRMNVRSKKIIEGLVKGRTEQWRIQLADKLEKFWQRFPDYHEKMQGQTITLAVEEGFPSAVITTIADRGSFDLIVLAANKKAYISTYAGRVTKGVIQRAKVPVVVVPTAC